MSRIRELREERQLNQKDLAKKLLLTNSTISDWERERTEPNINQLMQLSQIFGCSIDYIVGNETEDGIIVVSGNELSKDEEHLIEILRQLNPDDKDMVYRVAEMAYDIVKNN